MTGFSKEEKAVVGINLRLVDTETGEVIDTAEARGESSRSSKDFSAVLGGAGAGTYGAAPTRVQVFGPNVPLPNTRLQNVNAESSGSSTTSTSYVDVTAASLSITPSSAANAVRVQASAWVQAPAAATFNTGALAQLTDGANTVLDDVTNFGHSSPSGSGGTGHEGRTFFQKWHLPNSGAAVTYKLRHRASGGGAGGIGGRDAG